MSIRGVERKSKKRGHLGATERRDCLALLYKGFAGCFVLFPIDLCCLFCCGKLVVDLDNRTM